MKTVLARETEQKLHVNQLCIDFQQAVLKPQDVVFDYSDEGCMTLLVMLQGKCPKKTALTKLSQSLTRMAAEAAALAAELADEPAVTIDETNKAVTDAWPDMDSAIPAESPVAAEPINPLADLNRSQ